MVVRGRRPARAGLENLLDNAFKSRPMVATVYVEFDSKRRRALRVGDPGIGIPAGRR